LECLRSTSTPWDCRGVSVDDVVSLVVLLLTVVVAGAPCLVLLASIVQDPAVADVLTQSCSTLLVSSLWPQLDISSDWSYSWLRSDCVVEIVLTSKSVQLIICCLIVLDRACLILVISCIWIVPRLIEHHVWSCGDARLIQSCVFASLELLNDWWWWHNCICGPWLQAAIGAWCSIFKRLIMNVVSVWVVVSPSHSTSPVRCMCWPSAFLPVHLEYPLLLILADWLSLVLHKLFYNLMTIFWCIRVLTIVTLPSHIIALDCLSCAAHVRISVIVLLNLLCDPRSSHEPFFVRVFTILLLLLLLLLCLFQVLLSTSVKVLWRI